MIVKGRELILREGFLQQLADIQTYRATYSPEKARKYVNQILDFSFDIIAQNPYAFVEYFDKPTPDKRYRKAVFKKDYVIIYKVLANQIEFLAIYKTSQDPNSFAVE
jgi:plasmid stabilization system protein ParE